MSCGCGKKKCNGKCGISPSVLQINNSDCILFHRVDVPVSMGDEKENPPETGAYRNVLLYYAASGNSYLYSSDGIPTKLTGVVADYEVLLNKPWINGVELIGKKTLADLGITTAINDAVAAEATLRSNADSALSGRITSNATAIGNEKTARENADRGLSDRITTNANNLADEVLNRSNADTALSGRITDNANAIGSEKTAREGADRDLQDQITAVKATADSAIQPDDIDKTVMSDLSTSANPSTTQVILNEAKVNLKTGTTSSEQTSLPVASSTQAGVMNSATYDAVSSNTSNINAILGGAVAITGISANPSQSDLTTAWQNETGQSALINRASIYDVTNSKVWTYYTNDTTWHATTSASTITINQFTNSSLGTIMGSTNVGQVFAENDGTGSINGWDSLSDDVANAKSKLSGIEAGAEVNVQSDWNVSDNTSDAYIKNKPTIGDGTLTIQKNGTTVDTFTANSTTNKTVNITVPTVNDATLTIQKNGDTVETFTANASTNKTANITVPTKTSDLTNDSGFIVNDTHQVCGEGSNITLDTTTFEPLEVNALKGNTEQQTYIGKNLWDPGTKTVGNAWQASGTYDATAGILSVTGSSASGVHYVSLGDYTFTSGQTYAISFKTTGNYSQMRLLTANSSAPTGSTVEATTTNTHTLIFTPSTTEALRIGCYTSTSGTATFYDIQVEKSSSVTSFEPYVGGVPAPNPSYPQAVQTVTGENVVKICGKNLFDKNSASGLFEGYISGGKSWTTSGYWSYYVPCKPNTTYTASRTNIGNGGRFAIATSQVVPKNNVDVAQLTQDNAATSLTITTNSSAKYIIVWFANVNDAGSESLADWKAVQQIELGNQATAYQAYTGQSYEVNLGKNLINISQSTIDANGVTVTVGADNTITLDGTPTSNYNSNPILIANTPFLPVGETYSYLLKYISGSANGGSINLRLGATKTASNVQFSQNMLMGNTDAVRTVTMASSGDIGVSGYVTKIQLAFSTSVTFNNYKIQLQLEKGSQATSYASYFTPIELCKIGDYQDYIYKSGEKWYMHKEVEKVVLDGTEVISGVGWTKLPNVTLNTYYLDGYIQANRTDATNPYLCNYFKSISTDQRYIDLSFFLNISSRIVMTYDAITSVGDFKTWLGSHTPSLYYALATPTDTEITNAALIAQLNALWDADGYEGQTNIALTCAEGNAQGILSVCQYPSHLPIATTSKLGTVIVGHNLTIGEDGRLDANVNNGKLTVSQNGVSAGTFFANQSTDSTIDIDTHYDKIYEYVQETTSSSSFNIDVPIDFSEYYEFYYEFAQEPESAVNTSALRGVNLVDASDNNFQCERVGMWMNGENGDTTIHGDSTTSDAIGVAGTYGDYLAYISGTIVSTKTHVGEWPVFSSRGYGYLYFSLYQGRVGTQPQNIKKLRFNMRHPKAGSWITIYGKKRP